MHFSRREFDDDKPIVGHEPADRGDLNGEEVGRSNGFPMGGEKRAPRCSLTSLRRGLDAVFPQNIGDGAPGYRTAEIREGTANPCIPPLRIRLSHSHHELTDLGHDSGPSKLFPPLAVVPLPRNEPSVLSQQGFRCDDNRRLLLRVSGQAPYPLPRADIARRL